ncbi:MAG: O-antigen ligase family protein [Caldilineaceae bacterium]
MWESHPWVGVGPGNYAVVYPDVRLSLGRCTGHAHNVYLNILAESGLLGWRPT